MLGLLFGPGGWILTGGVLLVAAMSENEKPRKRGRSSDYEEQRTRVKEDERESIQRDINRFKADSIEHIRSKYKTEITFIYNSESIRIIVKNDIFDKKIKELQKDIQEVESTIDELKALEV